jgi:hypothetical protein
MKTLFALLAALGLGLVAGCNGPKVEKTKQDLKEVGHDAKEAGKEVVHDAAGAVKKGAEKVEDATK